MGDGGIFAGVEYFGHHMNITLGPITFHVYGLILGIAMWVALVMIERKARQKNLFPLPFSESFFWQTVVVVLTSGVIGARLWHVGTDFYLYKNNIGDVWKIWQGGLSILGGIVGGILGVIMLFRSQKKSWQLLLPVFDLVAFGLPLAQAVGRWANYVNQELYGWPTSLPWGIFIRPENRIVGFENFTHFHPLFLYESGAMLVFWVVIWWADIKKPQLFGQGKYGYWYLEYYILVRFALDFLRIDKAMIGELGVNQILLLGGVVLLWLLKAALRYTQVWQKKLS